MSSPGMPGWDPDDKTPGYLYMRLADHIAALIEAGRYPRGSMLPNERELTSEYGVSVDTIRRATAELRERGLVLTLPSKGSYVTDG